MRQRFILLVVAVALITAAYNGATCGRGAAGPGDRDASAASQTEEGAMVRFSFRLPRLLRLAVMLALALVLVAAVLLLFEDRLIYFPTRAPVAGWVPSAFGVEECTFETEDGLTLHALWHPGTGADEAGRRPVLLFCHGNAGNVTHRSENLHLLAQQGLAVLLFDYRGYGKSQGRPSEHGLYRDAEAAWRYLVEQRGIDPGRIVLFGRSLGAAVALRTALERPVAGLIMEGAFESVPAMARHKLPFVPVWFLVRNKFENLRRIDALSVPLLMVHGERDELVPIRQARAVFDAAPEPKGFHVVKGASHNDTYVVGADDYFSTLAQFCRQSVRAGGHAPRQ